MTRSHGTRLTDFEIDSEEETSEWPLPVGGHLVERVTPQIHVRGSGDNDTAFKCKNCGELIYVSKHRSVSDEEWVRNRFNLMSCSTDEAGIV